MKVKPQEVEGLRFSEPVPSAPVRRMAAKLDQPGLIRVQRQREVLQPLTLALGVGGALALPRSATGGQTG
jgi:hypothetical protein